MKLATASRGSAAILFVNVYELGEIVKVVRSDRHIVCASSLVMLPLLGGWGVIGCTLRS